MLIFGQIINFIINLLMVIFILPFYQKTGDKFCNYNGKEYLDSPNQCQCFQCYTGKYCQTFIGKDKCILNDVAGDPAMFQQFWEINSRKFNLYSDKYSTFSDPFEITLKTDYRTRYQRCEVLEPTTITNNNNINNNFESDLQNLRKISEINQVLLNPIFVKNKNKNNNKNEDGDDKPPENDELGLPSKLNVAIRSLHSQVGNAETKNYYIVLGTGGTSLIAASIWAYTQKILNNQQNNNNKLPVRVFCKPPHYGGYKKWSDMYPTITSFNNSLNQFGMENKMIEIVTTPNNPTGKVNFKNYYSNCKNIVHDMVYYWPSLTNIKTKADFDVMLFSMSKLSGHAGSRFGWALVKDKELAELMAKFIVRFEIHTSIDTQFRSLQILKELLNEKDLFFNWAQKKFKERWIKVLDLFEKYDKNNRFSILSEKNQFYLFIKCNNPNENCLKIFSQVGIWGWPGSSFGCEKGRYLRLELVLRDHGFDILMYKLEKLLKRY